MFERLITLIGDDNLKLIDSKKILLIGVGGVGSAALEALVRNGFNHITVVDYDKIEKSNLNRQLITNESNLGKLKADEAVIFSKNIRSDLDITGINIKLTKDNLDDLLHNNFDYVIDACDDIKIKYLLIEKRSLYNYKLISSMGTGKKLDPSMLEITTLDKTFNDPLARKLRELVKKNKIRDKIHVVSSKELPKKIEKLGTCSLVPNTAGILLISYIMNDILEK